MRRIAVRSSGRTAPSNSTGQKLSTNSALCKSTLLVVTLALAFLAVGCGSTSSAHQNPSNPSVATPVALTTSSLPNGAVGAAYSANLSAEGGTPPYTWSVVSGKLPAGLTLSSPGTIGGTPTSTGTFAFSVQVKDSGTSPQAASSAETIVIAPAGTPVPSPSPTPTPAPSPTPDTTALSVQVSGNHIVNQNGQTIHLIGFGHQGSEYMCLTTDQTYDDPNALSTTPQNMKAWGAAVNIARIPLNEDCWLGINGVTRGGTAYQNDIVTFANNLHAQGMYVNIDLHWNAPGTQQATASLSMADFDHSIAMWQQVATTFKNDPAVIFELDGEPHGSVTWECWQNGGAACVFDGFRIAGMEEMIQAIRGIEGTGFHHPIIVDCLGYSNDCTQFLTHVPADPASQLIVAIHDYDDGAGGPNGCPSSSGGAFNANGCADTVFGGIKKAGFPIMITEGGPFDCSYDTFMQDLYAWFDANGDGYEPYSWGAYGCSNPGLNSDWNGTPTPGYGTGTKTHMQSLPLTY